MLVIAAVATLAAATAAVLHSDDQRASRGKPPSVALPGAPTPARAPARRSFERRLSLAQLAGQRIIYAYSGLVPPTSLITQIRRGEAAGVIFFGPNISSATQIQSVTRELQRANALSPIHEPLLMLVDQEGGLVRRLPGAPALSERQIGQSANSLALAAQAGAGAGESLRRSGMNVNLAPVLDVFRQPGNFIDQLQRSYSMNAQAVAALGAAFVTEQQSTGVAATAKHFPGLGAAATGQNTDETPVTIGLSLNQLRTLDEAPYREAIAAGVKLVMLSWAIYPALDPRLPAGLSPSVVLGELRSRLGFRGVTITDAIAAGSLRSFGAPAELGVLAARAGADLLLCAATNVNDNSPSEGIDVLRGLVTALTSHRLSRTAADHAAARVLALRSHS